MKLSRRTSLRSEPAPHSSKVPSNRQSGRAVRFGLACAVVAACSGSSGGDTTGFGGSATGALGLGGTSTVPSSTGGTTSPGSGGTTSFGSGGAMSSAGGSSLSGSGGAPVPGTGGVTTATGGSGIGGKTSIDVGSGGSPGDAGSGGTTPTGGAGPGSVAGCPSGSVFCDDFEAVTTLGGAWTMDNTLAATIKVVNTYTTTPGPTAAHSGKNSVQISFGTGNGYAMIVEKMGFPAPTGYWGRVWLFIETPAGDTGHDVYIEGSTAMDLQNHGARPLNTQKGLITINIDPVGNAEAGANSTTPIPRGAWTCFEWQISATGGTGNIVTYVGGATTPIVSLNGKAIEALVEQRVGYERYNAGTAGNLWIDDYAIGSKRLGCM